MEQKTVTVFGGSGFLGRHVVSKLLNSGYRVKIVSPNPESANNIKPASPLGKLVSVYGNITDNESVKSAIKGSYAVINLVGIMHTRGGNRFTAVHAQGAENIAKESYKANIKKLIHVSALGIDQPSKSIYARSKANGEKAVIAAYPNAVIFRPSIMFGTKDNFFNLFAKVACYSPVIPLFGGGKSQFQPVYVADVAQAIVKSINMPKTNGKIYELGGPKIYSFKELMELVLKYTKRKCLLISIPFSLATIQAFFMELMPNPLLTRDQVKLLKINNLVNEKALSFKDLKITPKSLESIVPKYLTRFKK
ncbi:complex I NDUFA9 subunit family protein [Rickettsiales bacterium]|nr:complex I NDUFA9 subunit family protein [Rickettsiales bacterium]